MEPRSRHTSPDEAAFSVTAPLRHRLDLMVDDRRWRANMPDLTGFAARCLSTAWPWLDRDRVPNILLTNDRTVRKLNADFREKNKPTNVLTFEEAGGFGDGDIALAFETVAREACAAHRPFMHHAAHLMIHGLLHLAGHDHYRPDEARLMEMTEARILSRLGIPNPWRVGGRSTGGRTRP